MGAVLTFWRCGLMPLRSAGIPDLQAFDRLMPNPRLKTGFL